MRTGTVEGSLQLFGIIAVGTALFGLWQGYGIGEMIRIKGVEENLLHLAGQITRPYPHHRARSDARATDRPHWVSALAKRLRIFGGCGCGAANMAQLTRRDHRPWAR